MEARFVEIVAGVRIVQGVDFVSDDPAYAGTMTMSRKVTAADGGGEGRHHCQRRPDGIPAKDHAAGLASSLKNLAGYLER